MSDISSALTAIGDRPVSIENRQMRTGSELLADAVVLGEKLQSVPHDRILLRSPSARAHIIALCVGARIGADIYLAHASLPQDTFDEVVRDQSIDASIEVTEDGDFYVAPKYDCGDRSAQSDDTLGDPNTPQHIVLMTSGTTSAPKLARHTITSLCGRITATDSSKTARWLLTYSPSTFAGLQVILTSVLGGGTLISMTDRNPSEFARTMTSESATHVSGTPSLYRVLLANLDVASGGLRQITVGGEAVDQRLLDLLHNRFPLARIGHIYASTEAGMVFNVTDGREGFPVSWLDEGVGDVRLRISDGELEVLSPRKMAKYASGHANPITEDGWLATGDLVEVNGDRVQFIGRTDIRINVGGYKIAPEEVERALLGIPGIRDAQVTGVPNPLTGHVLVATLVSECGVDRDQLRADASRHLRQELDPYKVPRIYRFVDSIPVTPSGKKNRAV